MTKNKNVSQNGSNRKEFVLHWELLSKSDVKVVPIILHAEYPEFWNIGTKSEPLLQCIAPRTNTNSFRSIANHSEHFQEHFSFAFISVHSMNLDHFVRISKAPRQRL